VPHHFPRAKHKVEEERQEADSFRGNHKVCLEKKIKTKKRK